MEPFSPQKYGFDRIYEDNHLLIVNKPAGILVQGDATGDQPLVEKARQYLKEAYQKPGNVFCGVVHRLDRPVSGLVVLAKTSKGLERMNQLFRLRKVRKVYWTITKRRPPEAEGKLTHWLTKDPKKNKTTAFDAPKGDAKKSELHYRTLGKLNDHFLLEVSPITGRPHQIRAQLAAVGCPIRGDLKYGFAKANPDGSIHLHARRLFFVHPIKQEPLICTAPLPEQDFWEQFLTLDDFKVSQRRLDFLY
ncbi:MAG: RluA family pseudouridine synthase [Bernardetiaceae bacterium]